MLKSPFIILLVILAMAAAYQLKIKDMIHDQQPKVLSSSNSTDSKKDDTTPPGVRVGEISFYDKNGKKITLDNFKGKVVVVNLWATWCKPCVEELPSLNRMQDKFGVNDVAVVPIAMENMPISQLRTFLDNNNARGLNVYVDPEQQFPLKWKYQGIPTTLLVDRQGRVVKQFLGIFAWDEEAQLDEIRAVVAN